MNFLNLVSNAPVRPETDLEEVLQKTTFIQDGISYTLEGFIGNDIPVKMRSFYENSLTLMGFVCAMFMTYDDAKQTASELVDIVIDFDNSITKIIHRHDLSLPDCQRKVTGAINGCLIDLKLVVSGNSTVKSDRIVSRITYDAKPSNGEGYVDP